MPDQAKPKLYRDVIDALVEMCHEGQGQIAARRIRDGVWNPNATAGSAPDQHDINLLLARLSDSDRSILAKIVAEAVETGVFETLKTFEAFRVAPFDDGYEGSPFNDFIGRLSTDWDWPDQ